MKTCLLSVLFTYIHSIALCLSADISTTLEGNSAVSESLFPGGVNNPATRAISTGTTTSVTAREETPDANTSEEIDLIHERRIDAILGALESTTEISAWLASLGPDGKWPDNEVDYTTGCAAQRANWPAQEHWQRTLVMAGAWHGVAGEEQFKQDPEVLNAISRAMDYWFGRDFTNNACLDSGGTAACPCDNVDNSLWNTNWFSNIILIPELSGQVCLLVNDTLSPSQLSNCTNINQRSYNTFDHNINGVGFLTGANTLDVAKVGIDLALLTNNNTLLTDAYRRVHLELSIKDAPKSDGIRPDGSFGQHGGVLYNGNYGKDYTNDLLDLEIEASGTQFMANNNSQSAFATLFEGDRWMIFRNSITGVLHWDFSALGRFISFPVIDNQATGSIKISLSKVGELGKDWSSDTLVNFAEVTPNNITNANAGELQGNRLFYANDYMVHRGKEYVSTIKMYSSRTKNSECINSQNPFGFHLSDGVLFTYLHGNEYEDISVAWDWELIPGTTVDYGGTPLSCGSSSFTGIENFVGGVSDGETGIAVMRYTNPFTKAFHWQKAWFFLDDDVQHVMIANMSSSSSGIVRSVLDQKRQNGPVVTDKSQSPMDESITQTLWHDNVGYVLQNASQAFTLSIEVGDKTGDWSDIGTSTQPLATVSLFTAYIQHNSIDTPVCYTIFPDTTTSGFVKKNKRLRLQTIQNDAEISAIFDEKHNRMMAVFWNKAGGSLTFTPSKGAAAITVTSSGNAAVNYNMDTGELVVSDPSQLLSTIQLSLDLSASGKVPKHFGKERKESLTFQLPSGGLAGSSVVKSLDN